MFARAFERGLRVASVTASGDDPEALAAALGACEAEVAHVQSFLPDSTLYALYVAADAVLANSLKEPFGLVGLEVMAVGGIPVCGATGEDYAEPFVNALVVDTVDGRELAEYLRSIYGDDRTADRMRQAGYATANRLPLAARAGDPRPQARLHPEPLAVAQHGSIRMGPSRQARNDFPA